jgi:hypothetical protein
VGNGRSKRFFVLKQKLRQIPVDEAMYDISDSYGLFKH